MKHLKFSLLHSTEWLLTSIVRNLCTFWLTKQWSHLNCFHGNIYSQHLWTFHFQSTLMTDKAKHSQLTGHYKSQHSILFFLTVYYFKFGYLSCLQISDSDINTSLLHKFILNKNCSVDVVDALYISNQICVCPSLKTVLRNHYPILK